MGFLRRALLDFWVWLSLTIGCLTLLPLVHCAAGRCGCNYDRTELANGFDIGNGVVIADQFGNCSGARPATCVRPPWAGEGVPLCQIGDLEVVLASEPRPPVLFQGDKSYWDWLAKKIVLQYRNHSCHYVGNKQDCRAPRPDDAENLERFDLIGTYDTPIKADVLDYGADPTGQQFQVFREYIDGALVGWNVREPHETIKPTHALEARHMGNFSLVFGERNACLPFPDNSFDYVLSYNVLEHVNPVEHYLSEVHRVLRPGGLFYGKYYPHWFSARGHHLQAAVVRGKLRWLASEGYPECKDLPFEDDGKTVPDWGHLYMDEWEFHAALNRSALVACQPVIDLLRQFVYHDDRVFGLNKVHYQIVMKYLESKGMERVGLQLTQDVNVQPLEYHAARKIGQLYGHGDVLFSGVEMLFAKPMQQPATARQLAQHQEAQGRHQEEGEQDHAHMAMMARRHGTG